MEKKKVISIIIICVLAAFIAGSVLYFTVFKQDDTSKYDILNDVATKEYSINIKTAGNMLLSDIDVFVYFDDTYDKLIDYKKTDKNGNAVFTIPQYDKYVVVVSGIPEGYDVADHYSFNGDMTEITVTSKLIEGKNIYDGSFAIGNVMYDWSLNTSDGKEISISELLSDKKMLVIDFWYKEAHSIEQLNLLNDLYNQYSDSVEVLALNPVNTDEEISGFKVENSLNKFMENNTEAIDTDNDTLNIIDETSLNIHMASCSRRISALFGVSRCPSIVIIDRYGVVSMIEVGTVYSADQLTKVFDHYTAEEYTQKIYRNGITDFVSQAMPSPKVLEVVAKDKDNVKIPGVEIKYTSGEITYTAITDEAGVARFDVTTKLNDTLTVLNCPSEYKYSGAAEIILSDDMFTYNILFTKAQ
ncbi:MAG: redoxin domain-containing protein [Clostridia bacterium]|nr:redoxin domain-containing protein [Clostridia bacterium]